jgi:hypothetical protein
MKSWNQPRSYLIYQGEDEKDIENIKKIKLTLRKKGNLFIKNKKKKN